MDNEKLEKAKKLKEDIADISLVLSAFKDVGTQNNPEFVVVEGRGNYRANSFISPGTKKTIRLIVIAEIEEKLAELEKEFAAL